MIYRPSAGTVSASESDEQNDDSMVSPLNDPSSFQAAVDASIANVSAAQVPDSLPLTLRAEQSSVNVPSRGTTSRVVYRSAVGLESFNA